MIFKGVSVVHPTGCLRNPRSSARDSERDEAISLPQTDLSVYEDDMEEQNDNEVWPSEMTMESARNRRRMPKRQEAMEDERAIIYHEGQSQPSVFDEQVANFDDFLYDSSIENEGQIEGAEEEEEEEQELGAEVETIIKSRNLPMIEVAMASPSPPLPQQNMQQQQSLESHYF